MRNGLTQSHIEQKGSSHKFYCINDIWKPALASLARFEDGVDEGVKFVVSEKDLLTMEPEIRLKCQQLEKEEELVLGPMVEDDVKLMLELNHVKYDEPYGHLIIRQSQCFRDKTGKPVAWAGTHGDCKLFLPLMTMNVFQKLTRTRPMGLTWFPITFLGDL